ncbi:MAG: aromatic hydrocarbon degradation protein [Rhodospirillales bacterium 20-60-12]|nr:MAG: aromatic hydrocarbon degradation protein [Rhodospirillales bacterium 20-60-12]HQT67524.1 outer membrane protein transport protein [Acetobacteraceae bacterium]
MRKASGLIGGVSMIAMLAATSLSPIARAGGLGIPEQGTDAVAHSFAGATVYDDPATAFYNPAGMVLIQGNQFEGDLDFFDIKSKFSGQDSFGGGVNSTEGAGSYSGFVDPTVIPDNFGVFSLPGGLKAGFSLTTPDGGRIKFPANAQGNYQGNEAALTQIQLGLDVAVPVTDKFSIGFGPIVDYYQNVLGLNQNLGFLNPQTPDGAGAEGRFRGQSYSFGYNAGFMYQFTPDTRVGFDYRSKIFHKIKGVETISVGPQVNAFLNSPPFNTLIGVPPAASPGTDKWIFPQTISFGLYHRFSPQFAMMASAQWADWHQEQTLIIDDAAANKFTLGSIYTNFHFRSAWTVGVGADYKPVPKLTLMTGVGYDESPVTTPYRINLLPDNNRTMVSGGFSYQLLPFAKLQAAYAHYFIQGASINQTRQGLTSAGLNSTISGTLTGAYSLSADVFSTGVVVNF